MKRKRLSREVWRFTRSRYEQMRVDDRDELDAALESGDVARAQYDMALSEAETLMQNELSDRKAFEARTRGLLSRFRGRPIAEGIF